MGSVEDSGASNSNTVLSCPERVYSRETWLNDQKTNICLNVHSPSSICVTHLTPVIQRTDVMCVLVRQLLPVAASEAECVLVAEGGGVQPGGRVEAVVGEGLLRCRAQQLQEIKLDHVDRNTIRPAVGKLEEKHTHINIQVVHRHRTVYFFLI